MQSTVLALLADRGEYGLEKPDVAVFADTGWEPPSVYQHLDWLENPNYPTNWCELAPATYPRQHPERSEHRRAQRLPDASRPS